MLLQFQVLDLASYASALKYMLVLFNVFHFRHSFKNSEPIVSVNISWNAELCSCPIDDCTHLLLLWLLKTEQQQQSFNIKNENNC